MTIVANTIYSHVNFTVSFLLKPNLIPIRFANIIIETILNAAHTGIAKESSNSNTGIRSINVVANVPINAIIVDCLTSFRVWQRPIR